MCALSLHNHKIDTQFRACNEEKRQIMTVFDTGARPNLIRGIMLPPNEMSQMDTSWEIVQLLSAINHRLDDLGFVKLTVTVIGQTSRNDAIFKTRRIDGQVESIQVRRRICILQADSLSRSSGVARAPRWRTRLTTRRSSAPTGHIIRTSIVQQLGYSSNLERKRWCQSFAPSADYEYCNFMANCMSESEWWRCPTPSPIFMRA